MSQLHTALKKRVYHKADYDVGDSVYYKKYNLGRGKSDVVIGPCTVVYKDGKMRYVYRGGEVVSVPLYDLVPRLEYERDLQDLLDGIPDSGTSQDDGPSQVIPTSQSHVHFDDKVEVQEFFEPEDVVIQWSNQPSGHRDSIQQSPGKWIRSTPQTGPSRYTSIPGFRPDIKMSLDNIHAICTPAPYEERSQFFKDIIMKVPGRLITNEEEHVRLQSMPDTMKMNQRFMFPDSDKKLILEVFEDPLTHCTIRMNSETGDKYASPCEIGDHPSEINRFFEVVDSEVFAELDNKNRQFYPQHVLDAQARIGSRLSPMPYESKVFERTENPRSVKRAYEKMLGHRQSESTSLIEELLDLQCDYPHKNVSDIYMAYLQVHQDISPISHSISEHSDCTVYSSATQAHDVGISAYRQPSAVEMKTYESNFLEAKRKELQSWIDNDVFDVISDYHAEEVSNLISSRWLYNVKDNSEGKIVKFKTRLVIRGFQDNQLSSLQKDSPTVDKRSLRELLQFAVNHHYDIYSADISTAFLQGTHFETSGNRVVFVCPPSGTNTLLGFPDAAIWKLKKPAYGLSDAPRRFYDSLRTAFIDSGMTRSIQDFAMFVWKNGDTTEGLLVSHVDDVLYTGSSAFHKQCIVEILKRFQFGKLEKNRFDYCGSVVEYENGIISISQSHYTTKIPDIPYTSGDPTRMLTQDEYDMFRTGLGKLSWLSTCTRPDIAYDTNILSQQQHSPQVKHLNELRKLIKTTKAFAATRLEFAPLDNSRMFILAFTDASLATKTTVGNTSSCTSQTGSFILLASVDSYGNWTTNVFDWNSTKQKRIARSTLAAETLAMNDTIDRAFGIQNHYHHTQHLHLPIIIIADCQSLVATGHTTTNISEKRLKIDIGSIREAIERKEISVIHVNTQFQLADGLTKHMSTHDIRNSMKYHSLAQPVSEAIVKTDILQESLRNRQVHQYLSTNDTVVDCCMVTECTSPNSCESKCRKVEVSETSEVNPGSADASTAHDNSLNSDDVHAIDDTLKSSADDSAVHDALRPLDSGNSEVHDPARVSADILDVHDISISAHVIDAHDTSGVPNDSDAATVHDTDSLSHTESDDPSQAGDTHNTEVNPLDIEVISVESEPSRLGLKERGRRVPLLV